MASMSDVAKLAGVKEADAKKVLDAIAEICRRGDDVRYQGFGTFSKVHKEAYTGRNPATGEDVTVPAKDKLVFKQSKGLVMTPPKTATARRR